MNAPLADLTRWREHVPYVAPLTLIGALAASRTSGEPVGWNVALVLVANILANCLAFMVNDIEDAEDDAHDPDRGRRNAVTSGRIGRGTAWLASCVCGLASLVLFAQAGRAVLACGAATLLLSVLYSWSAVRLKALPVVDVLSHSLMLGGLLLLAGYLAVAPLDPSWGLPVAAVSLISAYGQFHNQLRDFAADAAAGLRNTALCVGRPATWMLLYACLAGAAICLALIAFRGTIPLWTFAVAAATALASWLLRARSGGDMRGAPASDPTAQAQRPMLDALNVMALAWLAETLIRS